LVGLHGASLQIGVFSSFVNVLDQARRCKQTEGGATRALHPCAFPH
jgi:hypothetical protein